MSPREGLEHAEVLWLLGSLSGFHRLPFDATLVAQEFPPPYTLATFHAAARSLGLKTGTAPLPKADWHTLPLPAVAFLRSLPQTTADPRGTPADPATTSTAPAAPSTTDSVASHTPILVLKADHGELLYFRAGSQSPETLPIAAAGERLQAELILVAKAPGATAGDEIAGFTAEKKRFGFHWFVPELLKHHSIWRDVLVASLAIQLVGLATPLFTQVIIDKVIVHQTHSTLIVLGVALVLCVLFTSGMTWLRQYLVLHTGNRIDAVLGSQVFKHLLRLPLPYFEQRPTGTLVARLQGVETIREFVSGAAVTLILDLPFLLVFLAVMFAYSWQLSLIAVGLLAAIALISFLVAPLFRDKLNQQFMRRFRFFGQSDKLTVIAVAAAPDDERRCVL
ncbi:MAG: ABC transporter transmembrane domain-containing protein, partial [Candidatus Accumulibacter sp.]|uniref:ABC transporter transmembrane domain-containing protein n=1 Tax=Accumulibacter sp. TaxID=2053492 RepID=UPI0025CCC7C8